MGKPMENMNTATTAFASRSICFLLAVSLSLPSGTAIAGADPLDSPNINAGDTTAPLPPIDRICEVLRNANKGNFIGKNGKEVTFTHSSCAAKRWRERTASETMGVAADGTEVPCQQSVTSLTAGYKDDEQRTKKIDELCRSGNGSLNQEAAAYCTLRTVAQTSQATQYCDAYESSERATEGLTAMLALNGAGAAICWTEYLSLKTLSASSTSTAASISSAAEKTGACSYAAMGAALGEIANVIMANTGRDSHATGEFKIDSSGNPIKKDDEKVKISKILDIVATSTMSLLLIRNGLCQQTRGANNGNMSEPAKGMLRKLGTDGVKKVCGFLNNNVAKNEKIAKNETDKGKARVKAQSDLVAFKDAFNKLKNEGCTGNSAQAHAKWENAFQEKESIVANGAQGSGGLCTERDGEAYLAALKSAEEKVKLTEEALIATDATTQALEIASKASAEEPAKIEARTKLQPRLDVTKSSAMIMTALAAMRGVSLVAAGSTKKKSKEILESMFRANGEGAPLGMSGLGNVQQNIFTATGGGTFAPTGSQPIRAGAVASSGTPEAYLLPPGSPLAAGAERIANQIPRTKLQEAASNGGSGIGNMIAATAGAMGAKGNLSEIRSVASTAFANLSQDGGGGYAGGSGRSVASTGAKEGGDLNLKSLFGAEGGGEGDAQAAPELAYREPANEDIWHSQNPKGHNLFQIVSDKYDTVQRKSAVGADL